MLNPLETGILVAFHTGLTEHDVRFNSDALKIVAGWRAEGIGAVGHDDNTTAERVHLAREVHGTGANLDSLETRDHRNLIERTCFSVEPGIYLPARFGVRSELDMTIEDGRAAISGGPPQQAILPLLTRFAS